MAALPPWPAFGGPSDWLGVRLESRRGIWGKVQGEASDFRWIARSPGFAERCPDLARHLRIGREDHPVHASLWRRLPGRHLAVQVYPSRARDRDGRPAVIEKQVVEVTLPGLVPACAGALLLLPAVAKYDDSDWWGVHESEPWHDPDHSLAIAACACPAPRLDVGALETAIGSGLSALCARLRIDTLTGFYTTLLSGEPRPAALAAIELLPPEAVAALLLPLPRTWADRLSIAGGLPARDPRREDLGPEWDAVAASLPEGRPAMPCDPEISEIAQLIAEALTSGETARLRDSYRNRDTLAVASHQSLPSLKRSPTTETADDLWLEGIEPPPVSAGRVIWLLYGFAREIDVRLLDVRAVAESLRTDGMPACGPEIERLLCRWPVALEEHKPPFADDEEWAIKCDQLRAAAWCLTPAPERATAPGLPVGRAIPALLLAVLGVSASIDERLAELGPDAFEAALVQSLCCSDEELAERVASWLDHWSARPSAPHWVSRMIPNV